MPLLDLAAITPRPRPPRAPDLLIAARRALALSAHPDNAELIDELHGDAHKVIEELHAAIVERLRA
jgi:hypothetical protein